MRELVPFSLTSCRNPPHTGPWPHLQLSISLFRGEGYRAAFHRWSSGVKDGVKIRCPSVFFPFFYNTGPRTFCFNTNMRISPALPPYRHFSSPAFCVPKEEVSSRSAPRPSDNPLASPLDPMKSRVYQVFPSLQYFSTLMFAWVTSARCVDGHRLPCCLVIPPPFFPFSNMITGIIAPPPPPTKPTVSSLFCSATS